MKILFRADGNQKVGLGHLIRCLTLAQNLLITFNINKSNIIFLSLNDRISSQIIQDHGFPIFRKDKESTEEDFIRSAITENGGNVLFVDKLYPYSSEFVNQIKKRIQVFMFHNVCEGAYSSNIFVLPAPHLNIEVFEKKAKENQSINFLHGFKYVIINEEIIKLKEISNKKKNDENIKILITTGGSDPKGVLLKLVKWIGSLNESIDVVAMIGQAFAHKKKLEEVKPDLPGFIKFRQFNPDEFVNADVAICTFGVSTYELMFLGLPILSIGHAPSNALGSKILSEKYQATVDLGFIDDLTKDKFLSILLFYIKNKEAREELSKRSIALVDGKGASRVAKLIYELGSEMTT